MLPTVVAYGKAIKNVEKWQDALHLLAQARKGASEKRILPEQHRTARTIAQELRKSKKTHHFSCIFPLNIAHLNTMKRLSEAVSRWMTPAFAATWYSTALPWHDVLGGRLWFCSRTYVTGPSSPIRWHGHGFGRHSLCSCSFFRCFWRWKHVLEP